MIDLFIFVNKFSAPLYKKVVQSRIPIKSEMSRSNLYTEAEKQVLMITSKINNIEYVPFMDVDLSER